MGQWALKIAAEKAASPPNVSRVHVADAQLVKVMTENTLQLQSLERAVRENTVVTRQWSASCQMLIAHAATGPSKPDESTRCSNAASPDRPESRPSLVEIVTTEES